LLIIQTLSNAGEGVGLGVLSKPQPAQAVKWLRIALAATASSDASFCITGEEDDTFTSTPDGLNPRGGLKAAAKPSFLRRNSSNGRAAAVVNGSFVGPCIGDDGLAIGSMFAIADQLGTAAEAAVAAARSEFDAAAEEEGKVRRSGGGWFWQSQCMRLLAWLRWSAEMPRQ
jgi:hypothetical protein